MTSEDFQKLIPAYISRQLAGPEKELFEEELAKNPELGIEVAELRSTWEELGLLPQEQPSAALRSRFYQRLSDVNNGRTRASTGFFAWWKPGLSGLVRQTGIAAVLFCFGLFVGRMNFSKPASNQDVEQLQSQVQDLRRTVALSLLERQSPASRLEGISWSTRVERPDPELLTALVNALNHDQNINVRLASLDALEKFTDDAAVRKALIDSIQRQDSPLVQIALIDALVHAGDRGAAGEFRKLTTEPDVNAAVQQRARWGLEKLRLN